MRKEIERSRPSEGPEGPPSSSSVSVPLLLAVFGHVAQPSRVAFAGDSAHAFTVLSPKDILAPLASQHVSAPLALKPCVCPRARMATQHTITGTSQTRPVHVVVNDPQPCLGHSEHDLHVALPGSVFDVPVFLCGLCVGRLWAPVAGIWVGVAVRLPCACGRLPVFATALLA